MKVLFISPTHGLYNRGAENSTHFIANHLTQYGNTVMVIGNGKPFLEYKYIYRDYKQGKNAYFQNKCNGLFSKILNRLYLTKANFYSLVILFKSLNNVKEFSPNAVVVHSAISLLFYKCLYRDAKTVVFSRAGIGFHTFDMLRLKPDLFISITPDISEYKKRVRKGTKLVYIPNGVDINFFSKRVEKLKVLNPIYKKVKDKKVILCVAAFVPYKRVGNLILASRGLKNFHLILVGEGPLEDDLRKLADRELGSGNFTFATFPKEVMPYIYTLADVTVLPSKSNEAFGNVLVESMACGTPVVGNSDISRKKIIGKGGLVADCGKPNEILKAIKIVFNSKLNTREQTMIFDYGNISKEIFDNLLQL